MNVLRLLKRVVLFIVILFVLPLSWMVAAYYTDNWQGVNKSSYVPVGVAQYPDYNIGESVIQVYAARAARWRGAFGVHTWMAAKRANEQHFTRFEVIGYRVYWGGDAVRVRIGTSNSNWYGNPSMLLREIRGKEQVEYLIDRLHAAAVSYPHQRRYHVWPGPNSNTFTAYLARQVPELRLELPSNAIGKDYLLGGSIIALTPSQTGGQISLGGYGGILAGFEEGLEINVLGLTVGIDFNPLALKLPGIGRIGLNDVNRKAM